GLRLPDNAPELLGARRQLGVLISGKQKGFVKASDLDQSLPPVGAVTGQVDAARSVGRPFAERIEFPFVGGVNFSFDRDRLGVARQRLVYLFQPRPVRHSVAVSHRHYHSLRVANSKISSRGRAFPLLPEIANIETGLSKFINHLADLFLRSVVADNRFVVLARE